MNRDHKTPVQRDALKPMDTTTPNSRTTHRTAPVFNLGSNFPLGHFVGVLVKEVLTKQTDAAGLRKLDEEEFEQAKQQVEEEPHNQFAKDRLARAKNRIANPPAVTTEYELQQPENNARGIVASHDMRVDAEGLYIKNGSPAVDRIFAGTNWANGAWKGALRQLKGAKATDPMKFPGGSNTAARATLIPFELLPEPIDDVDRIKTTAKEQPKNSQGRPENDVQGLLDLERRCGYSVTVTGTVTGETQGK